MRTPFLILVAAVTALAGCSKSSETNEATDEIAAADSDSAVALTDRQLFLKDNIEFQLRNNLDGRPIVMGSVQESEFEGLDKGSFSVGPQTYQFLTTEDDERIVFIAMDPFDSMSDDEMATVRVEEAEEARQREELAEQELAAASQNAPVRGNPDAPVTVIEFSDFECPYCKRGFDTMEQLLEKRGDEIRFVYLHFPLNFHPWAKPSAVASVCAARQDHDAFWTLHDYYFRNQDAIEVDNVVEKSKGALKGSGLDLAQWETCAADTASEAHQEALAVVDAQADLASRMGVTGTPGFFINGTFLSGAQPLEAFESAIDEAKREG